MSITARRRLTILTPALLASLATPLAGGEFDRYEGAELAAAVDDGRSTPRERLSVAQVAGLPAALGDTPSAFLVVKTGQGNYTRVLATAALRKPAEGDAAPAAPVVVLERFDTFEPGASGSRVARGAGLILFEGFQVDLDAGVVVPEGQGGDLAFGKGRGGTEPALTPLGKARLFAPTRRPAAATRSGPSPGKAVLPGDFAGRFRLNADGRWAGLLELQVAPDRQISGRFRSETNGTSYPVTGQVLAETPQHARFTIKFPRTEQEYDAFLGTAGKNVAAGSFTLLDRTYGFFAVREGADLGPPE